MSQENVEIVLAALDAWNLRDLAKTRELWRSDAEIDWSRSRGPLKGVYRGREETEDFQQEFWSTFEAGKIEPHAFIQAGSEVVVPNTTRMEGREGMEVVARSAFVFTVDRGQITRLRMFQERSEALEAVGLSE